MERFFEQQIALKGEEAVMLEYLPQLVSGAAAADFFHPLIELGYLTSAAARACNRLQYLVDAFCRYYFETGRSVSAILAASLAWLTTAYVPIEDATALPDRIFTCPHQALQALASTDYNFPKFDRDSGSAGYARAMTHLVEGHAAAVLQFDLDLSDVGDTMELVKQICFAAGRSFAPGCDDFYLLHSVTGSRAVWAILQSIHESAHVQTQRMLIQQLWRAMLFTHVARNNPPIASLESQTNPTRTWPEIIAWVLGPMSDMHIHKLIMNCADYHDQALRSNDGEQAIFWHTVADGSMTANLGPPSDDGKFRHCLHGGGFGVTLDDPWCGLYGSKKIDSTGGMKWKRPYAASKL